jgi:esterase/lipase
MNIKHSKDQSGVPYIHISGNGWFRENLVLLFHGFGQSKEKLLELGIGLFHKINTGKSSTNPTAVRIYDLTGHGVNKGILSLKYLFKSFAVIVLLLKKNFRSISLVGVSLGAVLSVFLASQYPDSIHSVCFFLFLTICIMLCQKSSDPW